MVCHSVDGVYRVEGETWSLNNCTQCLCHVGRVLCKTHHCPPTPCPMPVYQPGQCCAACPESAAIPGSEHGESCGAHRPHGAAWSEDICRSCVCVNGRVSCFTQQCPNISCSRPVLAKNQCCPVCLGKHFISFSFCLFGVDVYLLWMQFCDTTQHMDYCGCSSVIPQHMDINVVFSKLLSI